MAVLDRQTVLIDVRRTPLDDILAIPHGVARTDALQEFHDDEWNDGNVLIRTNDGKPMTATNGLVPLQFPPKGRRVTRGVAVNLLLDYGRGGKYHDMDVATGVTESMWRTMNPSQKQWYEGTEFHFQTQYLTHVLDDIDAVDDDGVEPLPEGLALNLVPDSE